MMKCTWRIYSCLDWRGMQTRYHSSSTLPTYKLMYVPQARPDTSRKPICLVTNMKSAALACEYYSKRFRIETFFSDQKSRGFSIGKSHLSNPDRLSRLMMAACLAYIWIIFLGAMAMHKGFNKIIHRTDRCDLTRLSHFKKNIPIFNGL